MAPVAQELECILQDEENQAEAEARSLQDDQITKAISWVNWQEEP